MDKSALPPGLEEIVERLFDRPGDNEMPSIEKKRFFLTKAEVDQHHEKLIETIVAIANRGSSMGLILCSGVGDPGEMIDAEQIDAKMRAVVGPAIHFTLQRVVVSNRTIDLISIPKSNIRPHLLRDRSNRFYIPLRGAANNATAARHDLDEMIQDQVLETMRRAFPTIQIDARDAILRYAQEIGYGLEGNDPQIAICLIPIPVESELRLQVAAEEQRANDRRLYDLMMRTVNAGHAQYYTVNGVTSTRYGEDFFESFEVSNNKDLSVVLWANRIYYNGTIVRRALLWQASLHGAWTIDWLIDEVAATLDYAAFAYQNYDINNFESIQLVVALQGVAKYPIRAKGFPPGRLATARDFADPLILPTRSSIIIKQTDLHDKAKAVGGDIGRIARTFYQD